MRLTDLPSVSSGLPRTIEGAREAIRRYKELNHDLPQPTLDTMALAAVAKRFGRRLLEGAVGYPLPRLPFRDSSWRWWNALDLAGLGVHWPVFVAGVYAGGVREGARRVRARCSPADYLLLLRRAGTNPHGANNFSSRNATRQLIWTKGGTWRAESGMTQLLVFKRHLQRRYVLPWQKKMKPHVRLLEQELHRLIDVDGVMSFEARRTALDYTRRRMAELTGSKRAQAPLHHAAWLLKSELPYDKDKTVAFNEETSYVRRERRRPNPHRTWSW